MARHRTSPDTAPILQLLSDYSFDVDTCAAEAMVTEWLQQFEPAWVSQAITEALYQGRYKVVSVEHILQMWQRRGQPLRHFNREFESIILGQSWGHFLSTTKANAASANTAPGTLTFGGEADAHGPPETATDLTKTSSVGHIPTPFSLNGSGPSLSGSKASPSNHTNHAEDSPAFAGGSSRTIPPLTADQLARLTQPAPTPASPEATTPIDDRTTKTWAENLPQDAPQALTKEAVSTEAAEATQAAEEAATFEALGIDTDTTKQATANEDGTNGYHPDPEPEPSAQPSPALAESHPAQAAIPNFQPIASPVLLAESTDSIPPFVPAPGPSELHQRLKAVVEAGRQDN